MKVARARIFLEEMIAMGEKADQVWVRSGKCSVYRYKSCTFLRQNGLLMFCNAIKSLSCV